MSRRAVSLAALLCLAAGAQAQLAPTARQCIDGYNHRLRLVSLQTGKSARLCLRQAAQGSATAPNACIAADGDGRIPGQAARVAALYGDGPCSGSEPIQRGAALGSAAHREAVTDLVHDVFGDPVTAAVIGLGRDEARCVDTAMKRAVQAFATLTHGHRQCTKRGLESGAVVDAASLDAACGTLAQIDAGGAAQARLTQLAGDVAVACGTAAAGLAALFPGLDSACHAGGAALGACVAERTRCRACRALAAADGQAIDCDVFDDGADDDSCAAPLGTRTCTFAPGSRLFIQNSALPLPIALGGAASIACGATDAAQSAACRCALATPLATVVPAIGDVCITPAPGCPDGAIDCDGGAARDVDFAGDHDIGPCASNAACAAACDAHCAGRGASYVRRAASCEGYCQGGASDEQPCAGHSDCPGATCVGEAAFHGNVCNCLCEGLGLGAASGAGHLDCALGLHLHVELPSDGDCLDTPVQTLPPRCVGVTTATATGLSRDADHMPNLSLPYAGPSRISGAAPSCEAFAEGSLSGTTLVGHTVFLDSTLGDNFASLTLVCE